MKKLIVLLFALCLYLGAFAQQLNYQAVIRDDNQQLVTNTNVTANIVVKVSGSAVYQQTVNGTTNLHGLFDIPFGDATFSSIDWPHATISVEVKNASTGVIYMPAEDRPVNAVPYALNATNAASATQVNADWNATSGVAEILNKPTLFSGDYNDLTNKPTIPTNVGDLTNDASYVDNSDCPAISFCDLYAMFTELQDSLAAMRSAINALNNRIIYPYNPNDGQPCTGTPTVTDYDGNVYNTIQVGTQCWTKENIRTTKYANGTLIALGDSASLSVKYRYYPNDNANNVASYGYLYNWQAAMNGAGTSSSIPSRIQGVCPTGWHIPSDAEWSELYFYVKNQDVYLCNNIQINVGKSLTSPNGWRDDENACAVGNNPSSNNATGFSAVPAGMYGDPNASSLYTSKHFGDGAWFWSATQNLTYDACGRYFYHDNPDMRSCGGGKEYGYSVRCLQDDVSSTSTSLPSVTTTSVTNITKNSATSGGNITADGGATITARGVCWSTSQNPTIADGHTTNGTGTGSFTSSITGLTAGSTYYVRAYATNEAGTAYGDQVNFTTHTLPTVTTKTITNITNNSATCGGNVTSDGGATITARGVCWSTSQNPTITNSHTTNGSGTGSFTSSITGLTEGTTYYVRAYATNSVGTSYGEQRTITPVFTCSSSTLTDRDGNTYNTVLIGTQCWMKENLKTTKYADGTSISLGSTTSTTTAYRYYPNNNSSNVSTYGYLYNWKAVMRNSSSSNSNPSGVQGVCPTGWHVPSDAEWIQMEMAVGMSQTNANATGYRGDIAANLSGNTGWSSSNNANAAGNASAINRNSSRFSALPAGRSYGGNPDMFGNAAHFWTTSYYSADQSYYRALSYDNSGVVRSGNFKNYGFSVRCVKN